MWIPECQFWHGWLRSGVLDTVRSAMRSNRSRAVSASRYGGFRALKLYRYFNCIRVRIFVPTGAPIGINLRTRLEGNRRSLLSWQRSIMPRFVASIIDVASLRYFVFACAWRLATNFLFALELNRWRIAWCVTLVGRLPFGANRSPPNMRPLNVPCGAEARGADQSRSLPRLRLVQLHALWVA